jgi:hypothetical protein
MNRSIPTLASKSNGVCRKEFGSEWVQTDTGTDTKFTTPSELSITGVYSPTTR